MKILGIGNAIVDVICKVEDDFITKNNLTKSTMKLIFDDKEFKDLLSNLKIEKTVSGGSVANSIVGLSQLGNDVGFIGKVNDDNLGSKYEDGLKQEQPTIYNERRNRKMSLKEWKNKELGQNLTGKWGCKMDLSKLNEKKDKKDGNNRHSTNSRLSNGMLSDTSINIDLNLSNMIDGDNNKMDIDDDESNNNNMIDTSTNLEDRKKIVFACIHIDINNKIFGIL